MAKTITQRVVFKNAKPETLYDMFLNVKHHKAIIGGHPTKINSKVGSSFTIHDGYIVGKNLQLVKDKLIVQSWVASDWSKGEPDSTFILLFEQQGKDTVINMTHANVPDKNAKSIKDGWGIYYWKPWKKYLTTLK